MLPADDAGVQFVKVRVTVLTAESRPETPSKVAPPAAAERVKLALPLQVPEIVKFLLNPLATSALWALFSGNDSVEVMGPVAVAVPPPPPPQPDKSAIAMGAMVRCKKFMVASLIY